MLKHKNMLRELKRLLSYIIPNDLEEIKVAGLYLL